MSTCTECPAEAVKDRTRCPHHLEVARKKGNAYYHKNKEQIAAKRRSSRGLGPDLTQRARRLMSQYGITVEQYDAMEAEQGGVCKICQRSESRYGAHGRVKRLAVDHCHETGEVRGLLCQDCNTALGLFDDDPERLRIALAYLARQAV